MAQEGSKECDLIATDLPRPASAAPRPRPAAVERSGSAYFLLAIEDVRKDDLRSLYVQYRPSLNGSHPLPGWPKHKPAC